MGSERYAAAWPSSTRLPTAAGAGCAIFWASSNGRNVDIAKDEVVSIPTSSPSVARPIATRRITPRVARSSVFGARVDVYGATSGNSYPLDWHQLCRPVCGWAAALALAARPTLDRVALRQLMIAACDKVGTLPYINGRNDDYGYGRVNAHRAVALAIECTAPAREQAGVRRTPTVRGRHLSPRGLGRIGGRAARLLNRASSTSAVVLWLALKTEGLPPMSTPASRRSAASSRHVQPAPARDARPECQRRRARQAETSRANRFAARASVPRGLGIKE